MRRPTGPFFADGLHKPGAGLRSCIWPTHGCRTTEESAWLRGRGGLQYDTTCSDSEAETTSCETESICSSSAMLARNRETEEPEIAATVSTLPELEIALRRQLRRFEQALQATEADCQELQCYFGIDTAEWCRKDLSTNASRLLESLSDFVVQIRGAWEDLEKHAQSKHGRLPSETPRKTPRKTSREASSQSSLQPSVQELQIIRPAVASVPQDADQLRESQRLNQMREWHRLVSMSRRRDRKSVV